MEVQLLSKIYRVSKLEERDVPTIFQLCKGNPQYYHYCPPAVSMDSIKEDMHALPKDKKLEDKYFLGFWKDDELVAVMDLVLKYPDEKTAWIGLFMMNAKMQGKGIGSKIIEEVCIYLQKKFSFIKLAYVKGNKQSENFWIKNKFNPTGATSQKENYELIVMERTV